MRAASWNIHAGIGSDGKRDLDRIVAHLARHAPDIMALQEIDARGVFPNPFATLKEALGGHGAHAATIVGADGDYGHAVISRYPLLEQRLHDISVSGREPRSIIEAHVATPAGPLAVLAAHFGLRMGERRYQASILAERARAIEGPLLVLGDFNDWSWRGPVARALGPIMPDRTAHLTFPARFPCFGLDRIFARPAGLLRHSFTDRRAGPASDHLPVIADIRMP
ncbi:endonuclease/exonuclease/phosphatase family protein [Acetobacteraceae bacterium H6797]|nr:endonuclease/exonuclease/phosphatase family protein [Acetobacteraceae bacterium H6797]